MKYLHHLLLLIPVATHSTAWWFGASEEFHLTLVMPDIAIFAIWLSREVISGWDGST